MKKIILSIITLAFMFISTAIATNVRGQLLFTGPYGASPAPNMSVIFKTWDAYGRLVPASTPSITDGNGMYYFYNIRSAKYIMEVYHGQVLKRRFEIFIPSHPQSRGVFYDIVPVAVR